MVDHDVLVVGGGPVGLLLACLVGQDGRRVRVCERRPEPGTQTRAIGIHRPGLDALDAAGVGTGVRSEALRLSGGEVRSRGRRLAALTFTTERPILTLAQPRTEELLRDRLRTLQPDALQSGSVVRSVRDEGAFVRVGIDGEHGRREETASIVVVADGVRSPLREAFGAGWRARTGTAGYAMLDVDDPPADDRAVLYFEPDGLVESFPLPGGRRRWVVREDRGGTVTSVAELAGLVAQRTGHALEVDPTAPVSSFRAAQHAARRLHRGRIVLLGDAAHEVSPIGGQGMNLGWVDALRLVAALRRTDRGAAPVLDGFAREVQRAARKAHHRSAFFMAMGAPAVAPVVAMREGLVRTLGSSALRPWTTGLITMRGL
ncbi:NAD(P)/FAD-dependent oxidoreductase [Microbacterium paraoxydans]|uniref:FAD-dependent oxidoreductase n=1 Tax=Microbacterium paraoxydans TaxID=199592 RepID=UPI0022856618|nr:NAD(P)/FAD-dependent oxidoreductase [Microbacterium paraoxydans]MCZ0710608.1 NAD(P)/FAD-dependent oxidoreductase [Microbacterium paraoxydans]